MENKIIEARKELALYFDPTAAIPASLQEFLSPSGNFLAKAVKFKQTDPNRNWKITQYEIFAAKMPERLFTINVNYDATFHNWILIDGKEYFVCAEDIYGGQTIVDLSNRKMNSYSPGEDGFISTEYNLSPANDILATFGCHWGGLYRIRIFDFRTPMILPWREIPSDPVFEDDEDFVGWEGRFLIKVKSENGTRVVDISGLYRDFLSGSGIGLKQG